MVSGHPADALAVLDTPTGAGTRRLCASARVAPEVPRLVCRRDGIAQFRGWVPSTSLLLFVLAVVPERVQRTVKTVKAKGA